MTYRRDIIGDFPESVSLPALIARWVHFRARCVLARAAAPLIERSPGAVILRSDVIRKELHGVDPLVGLQEAAYAPEVTARVYRMLLERARQVIAQGFSVIIDAAFLKEAERDQLSAEAQKLEADFHPIFLDAELSIRMNRVGSRRQDACDATSEVVRAQDAYDIGRLDWPVVDASAHPNRR